MDAFSNRLGPTDVATRVDVDSGPGGAGRDRTDDLRLAKPALSQLSYSPIARRTRTVQENLEVRPIRFDQSPNVESRHVPALQASGGRELVGLGGLEPPTSRLSGGRSNHLSYRP